MEFFFFCRDDVEENVARGLLVSVPRSIAQPYRTFSLWRFRDERNTTLRLCHFRQSVVIQGSLWEGFGRFLKVG